MARITLDPITRIEGHLRIDVEVNGGAVTNAWSSGQMWRGIENIVKGKWGFEPDPLKAAKLMIEHIDKKRKALGLDKARERVLVDMAMRRALD